MVEGCWVRQQDCFNKKSTPFELVVRCCKHGSVTVQTSWSLNLSIWIFQSLMKWHLGHCNAHNILLNISINTDVLGCCCLVPFLLSSPFWHQVVWVLDWWLVRWEYVGLEKCYTYDVYIYVIFLCTVWFSDSEIVLKYFICFFYICGCVVIWVFCLLISPLSIFLSQPMKLWSDHLLCWIPHWYLYQTVNI